MSRWFTPLTLLSLAMCVGLTIASFATRGSSLRIPRPDSGTLLSIQGGSIYFGSGQSSGRPIGLFIIACALLPMFWVLDKVFGGHRHRTGWQRCIQCGYDLRYTPHRCPECGMVPEKEPNPIDDG